MNQLTNYKHRVSRIENHASRIWNRVSRYESFTQNKPNLLNTQMNIGSVKTKYYENARLRRRAENKPKQTQRTLCEFFLFFTFLCPGYNLAIVDVADYERVSKYKWYAKKGWRTYYAIRGVQIYLGRFKRKADAARAYDEKAKEVYGEFACLNFPEKRSRRTAGA